MLTFRITLLTSVVVVIVLLNIAKIDVAATDECNNNGDCLRWYSNLKYCCQGKLEYYGSRVCGADCIGNKCISITDCAPGECCDTDGKCRKNCFTPEVSGAGANTCKNSSDCRSQYYGSTLKYCCRGITSYSESSSCGADCIGHSCKSSTDCAARECCLKDKCDSCTKIGLAGGVIAAIAAGTIILNVILVVMIIRCCRGANARRRRRCRAVRIRAVLLLEPEGTEVDTSRNAQESGQANPGHALPHPACVQNPPPYDQYPPSPGQDPPPAYGY